MNLEQSKVLKQFGLNLAESKRYKDVSLAAGRSYAETELARNLKSYEREFLMDEAASLPHTYHLRNGELFSQASDHPLFNIKKQIDGRERNGVTLEGFGKFEGIIAQAAPDAVSVWYSPDGPSGFEGVDFDSGRLYLNFKTSPSESTNFDIKIRPEFPVLPLLGALQEQADGTHPRFDSPEAGKMHYLSHPLATHLNTSEFFQFMEEYALHENNPVYISRRNSPDPASRTLTSVLLEVREMLEGYGGDNMQLLFDPPGDKSVDAMMREEDIMRRYLAVIAPYVERNNGTFTLYGCSTTSTVTAGDIRGVIASHSVDNLVSLHSTQHRLLTNNLPSSFEVKNDRYDNYKCPHCNESIQGELKGKPETWKTECPSCHGQLHCAK